MSDLYALVDNDLVLLYPLTIEDINIRNAPNEHYLKCLFANKLPLTNIIQFYTEFTQVIGNVVLVNYEINKKTMDSLFEELAALNPGGVVDISMVSADLLASFELLVKDNVQNLLDEFAQTRGYDDIKSTCTYVNSQIPSYSAEANRAIYLRDLTWATLYQYLGNVIAGTQPLPVDWAEIASILPALTWE